MPRNDNNQTFFCAENVENYAFCCAKNVENHAIFVEGFWQDFYARGRFMKYSMSAENGQNMFKPHSLPHWPNPQPDAPTISRDEVI